MDARSSREWSRRLACVLGGLLVLAAGAIGFLAPRAEAANQPYVALGDSVSSGIGASSPAHNYVGLLYADYQSSVGANQLLNLAQPATTSSTLISGGQLATALADVNAATDTRALTIGIGANDGYIGPCTGHWDSPSVCPFRANYVQILKQLKAALAADPGAESFKTMTYYNPAAGLGPAQEGPWNKLLFGDNLKASCTDVGANVGLTDVIDQEAGKLGVPVANPYPAFKQNGQSYIYSDHLHPNDAGYAAIAQAFRNATVPCQPDTKAPQTTITTGPVSRHTHDRTPTFGFRSSEAGSTFQCSLDRAAFKSCSSPHTASKLSYGRHSFRVRAIDKAHNIDATPARAAFKVIR